MIKYYILPFIFIFCLAPGSKVHSQGFLRTSNKQIVNGNNQEIILKGMGLGGWMLQEGYMMQTQDIANTQHELKAKISQLIGETGMEAFYDAWLANHVREIDIDSLAAWGFNSVRLPMHYNLFTLPIEKEPVTGQNTWLQKGFDLTDSLLKWCEKNQIYLILDLHAAPGGQGKDQAISDYDPSKPSLWESELNRKKTVALWQKLAERYANKEWIGGYDLINETNWELSGNSMLKSLYKEITDSIRKVDQNHIIFIEGNWFANDFTGLTPPWDNNMVYSFHKYWTFNNQSSIQWMLDIRNNFNIPIWLGESGENSNTWFRECIKLLEDNKIGWAWWPMKKIGSISGPLSIKKTEGYETLLNYWKGQAPKPTIEFASQALMELAENAKLEDFEYHPDVIDALFRQQNTSESKPYKTHLVPGLIYATDFDMGPNNSAYFDTDIANYHLSTNTFAAWNKGWAYRNDGVDIEPCNDNIITNGFNVGHTENGEWLQYTVHVAKTALYNIHVRTAAQNSNGVFHFSADGAYLGPNTKVPASGGWQNWQSTLVNNVMLAEGKNKLVFFIDTAGFNVSSFEFVESGEIGSIPASFTGAVTDSDAYTIHVSINKPLQTENTFNPVDFSININGTNLQVQSAELNSSNHRMIDLKISYMMKAGNKIHVTYTGNQIAAIDGTILENFYNKKVNNTLIPRHQIPGRIQAEDFYHNEGLAAETCTDTGGGTDMGWTDNGDYLDYLITVSNAGNYAVNYRIASLNTAGQIEMQLINENVVSLHTIDLPITGGWQTWTTATKNVELPAGNHKLRLLIKKGGFNINWFKFDFVSATKPELFRDNSFKIFPNPANNRIILKSDTNSELKYEFLNLTGQILVSGKILNSEEKPYEINVSGIPKGIYLIRINSESRIFSQKIIIN